MAVSDTIKEWRAGGRRALQGTFCPTRPRPRPCTRPSTPAPIRSAARLGRRGTRSRALACPSASVWARVCHLASSADYSHRPRGNAVTGFAAFGLALAVGIFMRNVSAAGRGGRGGRGSSSPPPAGPPHIGARPLQRQYPPDNHPDAPEPNWW